MPRATCGKSTVNSPSSTPTRSAMASTDPSSKRSWVVSTTLWINAMPPIPSTAARWQSHDLQQIPQAANGSNPRSVRPELLPNPSNVELGGVWRYRLVEAKYFSDQPFLWDAPARASHQYFPHRKF